MEDERLQDDDEITGFTAQYSIRKWTLAVWAVHEYD